MKPTAFACDAAGEHSTQVRIHGDREPGIVFSRASATAEFRGVATKARGSVTSGVALLHVCIADLDCDLRVDDADFIFFVRDYDTLLCP